MIQQQGTPTPWWAFRFRGQDRKGATHEARIAEQIPDERVAWTSIDGARNAGVVTFHRLADNLTRVTLQLDVDPEGPLDNIGDALGFVERRAKGDLKRFKEFIEDRGMETGAWRGDRLCRSAAMTVGPREATTADPGR